MPERTVEDEAPRDEIPAFKRRSREPTPTPEIPALRASNEPGTNITGEASANDAATDGRPIPEKSRTAIPKKSASAAATTSGSPSKGKVPEKINVQFEDVLDDEEEDRKLFELWTEH